MKEGDYTPIQLVGDFEYKQNEENEMKYFLILDGCSFIISTYYTTPLTEFDTPEYLGQTNKIQIDPVEIFEIEIEFTERCPLEKVLKVYDPRWGYITEGILFSRTLNNGQKKFIMKLTRFNMNG